MSKGLALCLLLPLLAVSLYWAFGSGESPVPREEEGRRVAETFLRLIHDRKATEAWNSTTAEFKSAEGRESFLRSVAATPHVVEELRFVSVQNVEIQGQPRAEYLFQTVQGKPVRVIPGRENGEWKVDHWQP